MYSLNKTFPSEPRKRQRPSIKFQNCVKKPSFDLFVRVVQETHKILYSPLLFSLVVTEEGVYIVEDTMHIRPREHKLGLTQKLHS